MNKKCIGKKFKAIKTFSREDNIFKEDEPYTLLSIEHNESLNIYYLTDSKNKNYMFPEFTLGGRFREYFISIDEERALIINKVLYED